MANDETNFITEELVKLGRLLGFRVANPSQRSMNNAPNIGVDVYVPEYDVVWYLDLENQFNLNPLKPLFKERPLLFEKLKHLPFAGFELEDSSLSSKYQLGNFVNLHDDFIFSFEIVSSVGADHKNDTYRRGIKLIRHYMNTLGKRNAFFADWQQLKASIDKYSGSTASEAIITKAIPARKKASGGEIGSTATRNHLYDLFSSTGMSVLEDYKPLSTKLEYKMINDLVQQCSLSDEMEFFLKRRHYKDPLTNVSTLSQSLSSSDYIPKIDIACGMFAPPNFSHWLSLLSMELREDAVNFPLLYNLARYFDETLKDLFIPLISTEIELKEYKHTIGGCLNLLSTSFIGVLASNNEGCRRIFEYLTREKGFSKLLFYEI